MNFVRRRFKAPTPKVLAWSATDDNPVGTEYIIMEYCEGVPSSARILDPKWWTHSHKLVDQLAICQLAMTVKPLSQFGSIYYKEHVSNELQKRPFYAPNIPEDDYSDRFRISPSVDRLFYKSERAAMNIDRGPCKLVSWHFDGCSDDYLEGSDAVSYFQAKIECEKA